MMSEPGAESSPIAPPTAPPAIASTTQAGLTGLVTGEYRCVQCSYVLCGLAVTAVCPECSTPVVNALRNTLLESASPVYRRQLMRGLEFVTGGVLLFIIMAVASGGVRSGLVSSIGERGVEVIITLLMMVPQVLILCGYWIYATPDPGYNGGDEPVRARKIIRGTTMAVAIALVLEAMSELATLAFSLAANIISTLATISGVIAIFLWLAHFLATMSYSQWVARRIPAQSLARRAQLYAWLIPLLVIGPFALLIVGGLIFGTVMFSQLLPLPGPNGPGAPPAPASAAFLGIGAMLLGCFWILAALAVVILYWNLLYRLRKQIQRIDRAAVPSAAPAM